MACREMKKTRKRPIAATGRSIEEAALLHVAGPVENCGCEKCCALQMDALSGPLCSHPHRSPSAILPRGCSVCDDCGVIIETGASESGSIEADLPTTRIAARTACALVR